MKKAIVIIPTYNERLTIEKTIDVLLNVFKTIKDWKMEILVVDDTSPDKTYELVSSISKKHRVVNLLINKQKSGLGGAYLKGMQHAFTDLNADVVFEFDADLSHDPKKIPLFLKSLDKGNQLVLGSRYIEGGSIPPEWGLHRKLLSMGANVLIPIILTDFRVKDWTSGYRALTREVYESVHPYLQGEKFSGYAFQIGFLYYALKLGFKVDPNIAYDFKDRLEGESKIGPEYIKNTLEFIIKMKIKEVIKHTFFKFAIVGGLGALIQLLTLEFWRQITPYEVATLLSIECAVISNFILNNVWTFADAKLSVAQLPLKFIQFNAASAGSIGIQFLIAFLGKTFIGTDHLLFIVPIIEKRIDTGLLFAVVGIVVGMAWNFFAYTKFIWKKPVVATKATLA